MRQEIEISVIIPNYNYGKYIEECISSVLESDFNHAELEIVIVDDASTDNSIKLINKLKKTTDILINLIKHKTNSGLAKTRNTGIKNAKGKYLFFLDSDNYINKDCLKKHYDFLKNNKEYSACYAPIQRFDNETKELQGIFSNEPYDYQRLTFGNYIDAMSMIKKDDLIEVGLYDENMPCSGWEDYNLWLQMGVQNKKIHFIEGEPLTQYRMHAPSMIHSMPANELNRLTRYIKTKFNIKDDGINSLEEKISSLANIKIVPALSEVTVQFFWASADMIFSEEKSHQQTYSLTTDATELSFDLPESEKEIQFIRLDIGNAIGLLNIHEIEIKDTAGQVIWKWDKYSIHYKNGLLMIANNSHWPGKAIQLSLSDDPHFVLATNITQVSSTKSTLHISLSAVGKNQFDYLDSLITTPISFITEHDISGLHEINEILKNENSQQTAEILHTRTLINNLNEEKTILNKRIALIEQNTHSIILEKQQHAEELKGLKSQLIEATKKISELAQLTDTILKHENTIKEYKLTEKNLLIQIEQSKEFILKQEALFIQNIESLNILNKNIVLEKENKDAQIIGKEKQLVEIINIKNKLQKELLDHSNSIIQLQTENNQQKKLLEYKIEQVTSLTNEKVKKETEIIALTKQITEITQQNGRLINQFDEQQKKLDLLNTDHFDLKKRNSEIENELFKTEEKNKVLENSIFLLRAELQEYINKYDKKNLFQIIINKLRKNNN